jgi:carboxymethylenebutenolidase
VAVPASEGSHSIIYGPVAIPIGAGEYTGYLARPDGPGTFPSVIILPGLRGIDPVAKALARHVAKHGRAAIVLDPYRGRGPDRGADDAELAAAYTELADARVLGDIGEVREYLATPDTAWTDASPSALVGIDVGGRFALLAAAHRRDVAAVAALAAPLGDGDGRVSVGELVGSIAVPVLAAYGADDDRIARDDVDAAQEAAPHARFFVYEGTGHAFYDPGSDDYHPGAEADVLARIRALLDQTLPLPA